MGRTLSEGIIFDAAMELVERDGVEALTLTAIANHLGVTQPALYRHVGGINEVWRGLGLRVRKRLQRTLADACAGRAGPDAVRAVATAWRAFGQEHPQLYRTTDKFPAAGDPELEEAVGRVIKVLASAVRGFGLDDEESIHCARVLRSALHGFEAFELDGGHPNPHEPNDTFEHLVELLIVGFAALKAGAVTPLVEESS